MARFIGFAFALVLLSGAVIGGCFDVPRRGGLLGGDASGRRTPETTTGARDTEGQNPPFDVGAVDQTSQRPDVSQDQLAPSIDLDDASLDSDESNPDLEDLVEDSDTALVPDIGTPTCDNPGFGIIAGVFASDGLITGLPAVDDVGAIYFGTHNATLYRLSCTGEKLWAWTYPCTGGGCPQAFEGSPLIDGEGRIIIGDDLLVPNFMFALDPGGKLLWTYKTELVYGQMDSSPVLTDDGTLFIGSRGTSGWAGLLGTMVGFDPSTGLPKPNLQLDTGAVVSSPASRANVLYFVERKGQLGTLENSLTAVTTAGKVLWKKTFFPVSGFSEAHFSSVALGSDGSVIVARNLLPAPYAEKPASYLYRFESTEGRLLETTYLGAQLVVGSPVVARRKSGDAIILAFEGGRLLSLDPRTGAYVFDIKLGAPIAGSPVLGNDGRIYVAAGTRLLRISHDGFFESNTSDVLELPDSPSSSLQIDNLGRIIVGTNGGLLLVLGSSATGVDGGAPWPSFRHDPKNRGTSAYAPSSCTIRRNLTPFRLETSLLPGATPGQILLSGVVAHVGGGATPDECRFLSLKNDSGQLIELCVQLPAGYEIPVVPGESIVLEYSAIGSAEGGLYERYVIWDKSGALRFFYWSGDLPYYDPATCAHDCPKLAFSKSSCPTEELSCGLIVHPALELSIPGGCNETTVVAPGEIRTFENLTDLCPPFRARVMVARTRKYQTMLCEDVPDTYAQLAIIVNQSVSQCNCSDNGDCRSNEICDTEARRCVPNRCLEGVNCGPTTTCNPYNGNCEALPEPQMACDTSANCLPGWVCNPQWRSILGHGLCQKNPCTLMDCNGGCSGLSGCIGACLSNCDCKKPGNVDGVCDVESRSCID